MCLGEHDVNGYSRTNGFDIKDAEDIFKSAEDCDVFINNACEDD